MSITEALMMIRNEIFSRIKYITGIRDMKLECTTTNSNISWSEKVLHCPVISLKYQQPTTLCYSLTEQWSSLLETPILITKFPLQSCFGIASNLCVQPGFQL